MLKSMFKLHFSGEPNGALCPNLLGLASALKDIFSHSALLRVFDAGHFMQLHPNLVETNYLVS